MSFWAFLLMLAPIFWIVIVLLFAWLLIAWHRVLLLGEVPKGLLTPFQRTRYLKYVVVLLVLLAVQVVADGIMFRFLLFFGGQAFLAHWTTDLILLLLRLPFFYLLLRMALILPHVAASDEIGLSGWWTSTRESNGTLWAITLVISSVGVLLRPASDAIISTSWFNPVSAAFQVLLLAYFITLVTTLYWSLKPSR